MEKTFDNFHFDCPIDCRADEKTTVAPDGAVIHTFSLSWNPADIKGKTNVHFFHEQDCIRDMFLWHPKSRADRRLPLHNCSLPVKSMTSVSAPIGCVFDASGKNRFTVAVSEVRQVVELQVASSINCTLCADVFLNLADFPETDHMELSIRIDESDVPMHEAIRRVTAWWETDCKLSPLPVPPIAKDAMYSTWYSFKQALFAKELLPEAKRAAELGLKTVLLDDGWQMDTYALDYKYAGDWEVSKVKFPDFASSVRDLHAMGLKVILWLTMAYVGHEAKNLDRFRDMTLWSSSLGHCCCLDPRYPEVREHLISSLTRLLSDYDLDGFKLDFIDEFHDYPDKPYKEGMDFRTVQDAVDRLMIDVQTALRNIKPELLIEFRQSYIGPAMRQYGNMFRVSDCPDDYLTNRLGTIDLRLLSGNTAVHSDMLIWNKHEPIEIAALQIVNILFATMQFSGKLWELPEEHKRMVRFWIGFMTEHKELLLDAPLFVEDPHLLYTVARTERGDESVIAVYGPQKCVKLSGAIRKTILANGTQDPRLILENPVSGDFCYTVQNCFGETVSSGTIAFGEEIRAFDVPVAGLLTLERR